MRTLRDIRLHLSDYKQSLDGFRLYTEKLSDKLIKEERDRLESEFSGLSKIINSLQNRAMDNMNIVSRSPYQILIVPKLTAVLKLFSEASARVAEVALQDSQAMKQISILATLYLPGSFLAVSQKSSKILPADYYLVHRASLALTCRSFIKRRLSSGL